MISNNGRVIIIVGRLSLSSNQYVTSGSDTEKRRYCRGSMIRNLCRTNSTVILQELGVRAVHATMDILTERIPFSRDFLFRQVTRAKRHACAETQYAAVDASNVIWRTLPRTCTCAFSVCSYDWSIFSWRIFLKQFVHALFWKREIGNYNYLSPFLLVGNEARLLSFLHACNCNWWFSCNNKLSPYYYYLSRTRIYRINIKVRVILWRVILWRAIYFHSRMFGMWIRDKDLINRI